MNECDKDLSWGGCTAGWQTLQDKRGSARKDLGQQEVQEGAQCLPSVQCEGGDVVALVTEELALRSDP